MTALTEQRTSGQRHGIVAAKLAAGVSGPVATRGLLAGAVRQAAAEHLPLGVLVAVYTLAGWIGWSVLGVESLSPSSIPNPLSSGFTDLALLGGGVVLLCRVLRIALWDASGAGMPTRERWKRLESGPLSLSRIISAGTALVLCSAFFDWFIAFKRSIPVFRPFRFDPAFASWDRALHFGNDAWTLLHPLVGHPAATAAIQVVYVTGWFGLLYVATVAMAWHPDRRLRAQFFLAAIAQWILIGTVLATLLSSAGPCYYEAVTGNDQFRPLMRYLESVAAPFGPTAVEIQNALWVDHASGSVEGYGISAMPSMHVGAAVLLALVGWRMHRALGAALTAFTAVILVGSVHLGWHYAVDGYVAIAATVGIWRGAGRIVDGYDRITGAFGGPRPAGASAAG